MKFSALLMVPALFLLAGAPGITAPSDQSAGDTGSQKTQDTPQTITIPFTYDPETIPRMVVQVSINGHKPVPFLVDTGFTSPITIESQAARKLRLKPDKSAQQKNPIAGSWTMLKSVFIEGENPDSGLNVNVPDPMPVLDLGDFEPMFVGVRIAGIIGLPLLSEYPCRFDFQARTITFFIGQHYEPPAGAVSLPLTPDPTNDGLVDIPVSLSGNSPVELEVDTGADFTSAPLSSAAGLKPDAATSTGTSSLYGTYVTPEYLLPQIGLGSMAVDHAVVNFLPPTKVQRTLGLNILRLFAFTLDIPDQKLILEKPYTAPPSPNRAGWSGIEAKSQGKNWIVDSIDTGSPAEKAGVHEGDRIVSVDGHDLTGLPSLTVDSLLYGQMGDPAEIHVLRDGAPLSFSFVRADKFAEPANPTDGLAIEMIPGKPFTILNVAPGSAGENVGLKAQDKILSIDNISTSTMKLEQIIDVLQQDQIDLSIQRAGEPAPLSIHLASK